MCGLPGYGPGDLIDFEFSGDTIEVTFSAGIDHPLRLTSPEATGVLVALRALVDVPGMVDPEAARSAIAKIESAAGTVDHGAEAAVDEPAPIESQAAAAVRDAVRGGHALSIEYYSASHDMLSSRIVDPIRVVLVGDHSYLEAWCRSAEGVRLFRFDRIVDASRPRRAVGAARACRRRPPPDTSLFDADPSLPSATLLIDRSASWMFDYYPLRVVRELPDGACEAAMTYASDEWMARFVLGFGSGVRVLAPESLAERVRDVGGRRRCVRMASPHKRAGRLDHRRLEVTKLGGLQPWHWVIVIAVFVLLFGAKKLPDAARSLGQVDADLQVRGQGDEDGRQAGDAAAQRRSPRSASTRRHRSAVRAPSTNARPDPTPNVSAADAASLAPRRTHSPCRPQESSRDSTLVVVVRGSIPTAPCRSSTTFTNCATGC